MPLFLRNRKRNISERMDDPDCGKTELFNTYRYFGDINGLISQWRTIYKRHIRPYARLNGKCCSILDIGFGGGDIPIKLAEWCRADGIRAEITGIDTDDRAFEFVKGHDLPDTVTFKLASSTDLTSQGRNFDFVISNHLLHHLTGDAFFNLLDEARTLSTHRVLFNDIERSDLGYLLFSILTWPLFRSSFITEDGLTSIKRSYTHRELQQKVPKGWQVERIFPYRLLLTYLHE